MPKDICVGSILVHLYHIRFYWRDWLIQKYSHTHITLKNSRNAKKSKEIIVREKGSMFTFMNIYSIHRLPPNKPIGKIKKDKLINHQFCMHKIDSIHKTLKADFFYYYFFSSTTQLEVIKKSVTSNFPHIHTISIISPLSHNCSFEETCNTVYNGCIFLSISQFILVREKIHVLPSKIAFGYSDKFGNLSDRLQKNSCWRV